MVRRAAERALAQGMRTQACLECLAAVRARVDVPLVPMTYSSLLEAYGWERFAADARAAGATSLIVADLPAGDHPGAAAGSSSSPRRRRTSGSGSRRQQTDGWLYLVTRDRHDGRPLRTLRVARAAGGARAGGRAGVPLYAGFGISTPADARAAAELTDGVVVGSRALEAAEDGAGGAARLRPLAAGRARLAETPSGLPRIG